MEGDYRSGPICCPLGPCWTSGSGSAQLDREAFARPDDLVDARRGLVVGQRSEDAVDLVVAVRGVVV